MSSGFHRLRVTETRAETKQVTSVVFDVPPPLGEMFRWKAGQHVTLRFDLGGDEVRRPYSISDSPEGGAPLRVTVKRHKGGLVSNHINDRVAAGDVIDVMPPFGGFYLDPDATARRTYYFFGAGSGITPLFAMIRSVLVAERYSVVRLAYGNANAGSAIFREDLARLEEQSGGRLTVCHVLSSPSRSSPLRPWRRGRIDARCVARLINEHPPYAQDTQYYVCGPGGMNAAVRAALMDLDVPDTRIHMESYSPAAPPDDSVAGMASAATVRLGGATLSVAVAEGQTVLDAVRATGEGSSLLLRVGGVRRLPGSPAPREGPSPGPHGSHRRRDRRRRHPHLPGPSDHLAADRGIRLATRGAYQ